MATRLKLPLEKLIIPERLRVDYGDIEDLASSLSRYGLIQPVIVTQDNILIAGGRRTAAARHLGWTEIDIWYKDTVTEDERLEMELEENVRRKDMSWQERVKAIAVIHAAKRRTAALNGDRWGYRETGELLGSAHSAVAYALEAAELLAKGDKEVEACSSMNDFLRLMLMRRETALVAKNNEQTKAAITAKAVVPVGRVIADLLAPEAAIPIIAVGEKKDIRLSRLVHHSDIRSFFKDELNSDPNGDTHGAILTDPPYAIDVDTMDQAVGGLVDVDLIRAEHNVEENVELLKEFVPLAYHHLRSSGSWLVMFCDPWNWRWLCDLCEATGFRVQRWPLVWCKSHLCSNTNADKNFTKTVEFALVAAKGPASLAVKRPQCHFVASNDEARKLLGHPFAKPIVLWKWLIEAFVRPGMAFLDPFAGRGSAALAAIESGVVPISVEKNEIHFTHLYSNVKTKYEATFGKDRVTFS